MGRGNEEMLSIKRDKSHVLFGGTKILQHTPDKVVHVKPPAPGNFFFSRHVFRAFKLMLLSLLLDFRPFL